MSYRSIWPTRAELEDIDHKNVEHMIPLNCKGGPTPFQPVGPSRPVRRGATWEGASEFIQRAEERNRRLT